MWWASKGALESHLLHVLECLILNFFAFYINHHKFSPPPKNSLVCHINYQCLSSLDLLFRRERAFVFPVKMMEKQKGDGKLEVWRQMCAWVNTNDSALVFWTVNGQSAALLVLQMSKVKATLLLKQLTHTFSAMLELGALTWSIKYLLLWCNAQSSALAKPGSIRYPLSRRLPPSPPCSLIPFYLRALPMALALSHYSQPPHDIPIISLQGIPNPHGMQAVFLG